MYLYVNFIKYIWQVLVIAKQRIDGTQLLCIHWGEYSDNPEPFN